jgi:hypothetical protein
MVELGFKYSLDDLSVIDFLKKEFFSDPNMIVVNNGKQNLERHFGTLRKYNVNGYERDYWENHLDIYNYLNENTYPRDPDYVITSSWIKYYKVGAFSGLHAESKAWPSKEIQYTNVTLLDQSEDIEGGQIILAGDSYEINWKDPNAKGNLRERLLTRFLKSPGESIVWDEKSVHGVSRIEKGHRLVFICIKNKLER